MRYSCWKTNVRSTRGEYVILISFFKELIVTRTRLFFMLYVHVQVVQLNTSEMSLPSVFPRYYTQTRLLYCNLYPQTLHPLWKLINESWNVSCKPGKSEKRMSGRGKRVEWELKFPVWYIRPVYTAEQCHSSPLQARVSVQQTGLTNSDSQGEGRNVGLCILQAEREQGHAALSRSPCYPM